MGATTHADGTAIEAYRDRLRGTLLEPGDDGYDDARSVWNGMIDARPSLVARCAGTADVIASIDFAREHDVPLAVKAGGHNVAGRAVREDGLVVDLSPMDAVRIDPDARTARVEPGATWADFDHEAQAFGLATTGGVDSRTGVAGLTLGGGIGWLARSHGLACDNLIAADVVTADGELVHASESTNPELLWGLRGGGGNFGIVTSLQFDLHEVGPEVLTAQAFHPAENAAEVLRFYREYTAQAPDEVAPYALLVNVPPEPPFPEEYHLETAVALVATYAGDPADGRPYLEQLDGVDSEPIVSFVDTMPYTDLQQSFDDGAPAGERYYYKSTYLADLPDDAADTIADHAVPLPAPFTIVGLEPMGGAINRVDPTATAYPHRDAGFSFGIWAGWSDPDRDDEMTEWTQQFHEAMAPHSTGGVYANYLDRDDDERTGEAYGANMERLADIKAEYDPDNLFDMAPDVRPDG